MSLRTSLAATLLLISWWNNAPAQDKVVPPANTGLVLEMAFIKSAPPAYQTVYSSDSANPGNLSFRFGRVAGWQLPPGTQPVGLVRVLPVLRDKAVIVRVSVLRGKHMESEEAVGTYTLGENEKVLVEAAKNFGVEPFEIKVIRLSSLPTNLPAVENKLPSLDVVGVEQVVSSLPFIKITFRNLSEKSIEAVYFEVLQGDRLIGRSMPQGKEGYPLMLHGDAYEWSIPLGTRSDGIAGNYLPAVIKDQRVVITGIFFSDGTSEGAPNTDLLKRLRHGRKIELRRILPLFENALAQSDSDLSDGPAKLRLQVEALNYKLTADEQEELNKTLTVKEQASNLVENSSYIIKKDLLDFLKHFPAVMDGKLFRTWLVRAKDHYSNWLVRLETVPVPPN